MKTYVNQVTPIKPHAPEQPVLAPKERKVIYTAGYLSNIPNMKILKQKVANENLYLFYVSVLSTVDGVYFVSDNVSSHADQFLIANYDVLENAPTSYNHRTLHGDQLFEKYDMEFLNYEEFFNVISLTKPVSK